MPNLKTGNVLKIKMKLTKGGKAFICCLPADISSISCKEGEVAASVFERYRADTYREAVINIYIAAMILSMRFKNSAEVLKKLLKKIKKD